MYVSTYCTYLQAYRWWPCSDLAEKTPGEDILDWSAKYTLCTRKHYTVNDIIVFSVTCIVCNARFNIHHAEIIIQIHITSRNTHIITYHHANMLNLPFSAHFHHLRMNCCAVHLSCYWPQDWCEVPCQRRRWDKIEHAVNIVRNLTCNGKDT